MTAAAETPGLGNIVIKSVYGMSFDIVSQLGRVHRNAHSDRVGLEIRVVLWEDFRIKRKIVLQVISDGFAERCIKITDPLSYCGRCQSSDKDILTGLLIS